MLPKHRCAAYADELSAFSYVLNSGESLSKSWLMDAVGPGGMLSVLGPGYSKWMVQKEPSLFQLEWEEGAGRVGTWAHVNARRLDLTYTDCTKNGSVEVNAPLPKIPTSQADVLLFSWDWEGRTDHQSTLTWNTHLLSRNQPPHFICEGFYFHLEKNSILQKSCNSSIHIHKSYTEPQFTNS